MAGLGKIEVTPQELRDVATTVTGLVDEYMENYEDLYEVVAELKEMDAWVGADQAAFADQLDVLKKDFIALGQDMKHYAEFLNMTAAAYENSQKSVIDDVKRTLKTDA